MDVPGITKNYLKTITINGKYKYRVFLVDANGPQWLEAFPIWKGYRRAADDMNVLKIILENDIMCIEAREKQRTR